MIQKKSLKEQNDVWREKINMGNIKCTLCGSEEISFIPNTVRNDIEHQYKMYRCEHCETHFLYPRPISEQLQNYYDGQFREEVHTQNYYDYEILNKVFCRFTPEAKQRVQRVEADLNVQDDVLEIGCSVGYFLDAVAQKVNSVCGTEWDQKAKQYIIDCKRYENIQVATNPDDFGRKFDKIFMFHVLEHIEEPIVFLKGLTSLLKENGVIYIEVPNVDDILVKTYQCEAFKKFYYKKAHLYNFNEKSLAYVFEKAGYQYHIDFIQRYDLSNHLHWLHTGMPGGKGKYAQILGAEVNAAYVKALKEHKQTDTLFAKIWI